MEGDCSSSDSDGNFRPPIARKKKGEKQPSGEDELSSKIEKLMLEEATLVVSKSKP